MDAFAPTLAAAQARLAAVRPGDYARSRNQLNGAVTGLSPYLSHRMISLPEVLGSVASRHRVDLQHKFVYELGWREYFHHVWAWRGDGIFQSLHQGPLLDIAYADAVPEDVRQARTGLPVIDQAVRALYATGYLHNHARMWLASYLVHWRKVHWRAGADWLWGHLLDGDLASNHLSWQWVAGTGSHKPYLFNAENVRRYAPPDWHSDGTELDHSYETLGALALRSDAWAPVSMALRAAAVDAMEEPALEAVPPADWVPPDAAAVAGRDVWLFHPWNLADPPSDLPADVLCVAICLREFHQQRPWSARRWRFVGTRMRALAGLRWWGGRAELAVALRGARSVRSQAEPHLGPLLDGLASCQAAPRLFGTVTVPCTSFSQWWRHATRDISQVDQLPGLAHWAWSEDSAARQERLSF
ncbi:FAD-binding domain-containing protein [Ideonella sp.]|uniref:FAD-binding domain-containing protein n=1 Tax=Ideonella sp. TaxID=1929293 RepID=UPI003BB80EB8